MFDESSVLCTLTSEFRKSGFQGYLPSALSLGPLLTPGYFLYLNRSLAERDENYKQVVPYTLVRRGGEYLTYRRPPKTGDSRLRGLRSLGVGGHVHPGDARRDGQSNADDVRWRSPVMAVLRAARRELYEEVGLSRDLRIVGLVNDDSNPVGRVHLGVVCEVELDRDFQWGMLMPSDEVRDPEFHDPAYLYPDDPRGTWESWSRHILTYIRSFGGLNGGVGGGPIVGRIDPDGPTFGPEAA